MWPGSCLVLNSTSGATCEGVDRAWFSHGCPNRYGWLSLAGLGLYIAAFAPGMGPVPWAVNSGEPSSHWDSLRKRKHGFV